MVPFSSSTDSEVPGLGADAYAASVDHLSSLEKFGRKWYASGVEAGLAQAAQNGEIRVIPVPNPKSEEDTQDLVASLLTRNEELEKKVKGLEENDKDSGGKYNQIECLEEAAQTCKDSLISAHAAIAIMIKSARGIHPVWLYEKLVSINAKIEDRKNECIDSIDKARRESKKRPRESQGCEGSGSSSKHRRHN
ncbi:hypothetical protein FAUST_8501 [Fusarium austroamericanum]|uniref:Uncharacterized protein n=1 Tax=Fusarium austroamericanum TaxID=282268 RepID=A0AAN6BXW1_FUSAU|nr:hypothetical protein FAUST_8501 [Fusarium austroamericanum]